ncbi:hypothetical protein VUR80DRAFT_1042 [Thermomyces stellatus]
MGATQLPNALVGQVPPPSPESNLFAVNVGSDTLTTPVCPVTSQLRHRLDEAQPLSACLPPMHPVLSMDLQTVDASALARDRDPAAWGPG